MLSQFEAGPSYKNVKGGGDVADDDIRGENCSLKLLAVLDIHLAVCAAVQPPFFRQFFRLFQHVACDVNAILGQEELLWDWRAGRR